LIIFESEVATAIRRGLLKVEQLLSTQVRRIAHHPDGCDVDADAWPRTNRGFGCRSYQDEGKISELPSKEMLRS
jgi:hypothetical protein